MDADSNEACYVRAVPFFLSLGLEWPSHYAQHNIVLQKVSQGCVHICRRLPVPRSRAAFLCKHSPLQAAEAHGQGSQRQAPALSGGSGHGELCRLLLVQPAPGTPPPSRGTFCAPAS